MGSFPATETGSKFQTEQFKIRIGNRGKPMFVKMEKLENSPMLRFKEKSSTGLVFYIPAATFKSHLLHFPAHKFFMQLQYFRGRFTQADKQFIKTPCSI